ncbi:unnamed protein product [Arctogadus glacialis]
MRFCGLEFISKSSDDSRPMRTTYCCSLADVKPERSHYYVGSMTEYRGDATPKASWISSREREGLIPVSHHSNVLLHPHCPSLPLPQPGSPSPAQYFPPPPDSFSTPLSRGVAVHLSIPEVLGSRHALLNNPSLQTLPQKVLLPKSLTHRPHPIKTCCDLLQPCSPLLLAGPEDPWLQEAMYLK